MSKTMIALVITIVLTVAVLTVLTLSIQAAPFAPMGEVCPSVDGYSLIAERQNERTLTCRYVQGGGYPSTR